MVDPIISSGVGTQFSPRAPDQQLPGGVPWYSHVRRGSAGGYVLPRDDAQPARVDGVLATSRAFGNFRFKDVAHAPGGPGAGGAGEAGSVGRCPCHPIGLRKVSAVPDVSILEGRLGDVLVLLGMAWCQE
eukprot:Skav229083  [mRNA]  locus=scaffold2422:77603:78480:+ [translate_table: standard]